MMYDRLATLNKSKTTWRIKVRVMQIWPTQSAANKDLSGFNLILCDEDEYLIHVFLFPDQWRKIKETIKEGSIYIISHFSVKEAYGKLKPVFSKYSISFLDSTNVTKVNEDDYMIPMYKFQFVDLEDLDQYVKETPKDEKEELPEFAIDVIGAVEEMDPVKKTSTKIGLRDVFRFKVTDGRISHRVTVWGDDGINLRNKLEKEEIEQVEPVIIIMTNTKLFKSNNNIYIGTLPSTKIYINLEDDVVIAMRGRLEELGYKGKSVPEQQDDVIPMEMLTIKRMNEITDKAYIEKEILCRIRVIGIEDQDSWWYNGCDECQNEVTKIDGKIKCSKCLKILPVAQKRYRVCILAEDHTEACNIVLLDKAMRRILGITVPKLLAELSKGKDKGKDVGFPHIINDIVGKEYTLNIEMNEENILKDSSIYYATDICDFKITNEVSNSNISQNQCPSISFTQTLESAPVTTTPGTGKSSNKTRLSSYKDDGGIDEVTKQLNKKIKQETKV